MINLLVLILILINCTVGRTFLKINYLLFLIYNAVLFISYVPLKWKLSIIILILKPSKSLDSISSYRLTSLLPVLFEIFEKISCKRLIPITYKSQIIFNAQFSFRPIQLIIHQLHYTVDLMSSAMENMLYRASVNVSQASIVSGTLCLLNYILKTVSL